MLPKRLNRVDGDVKKVNSEIVRVCGPNVKTVPYKVAPGLNRKARRMLAKRARNSGD